MHHNRIVALVSLRQKVLLALLVAHLGLSAMQRRARAVVFWPGMTNSIHCVCDVCVYCSRNAPYQAAPPPMPSNPPATPFEQFFCGQFNYGGRYFLVIGNRFSVWAGIFATAPGLSVAGAAALVCLLRVFFATFGVPVEISTDGGPNLKHL